MAPPRNMALECPAKINLFLAVTGRRPDGFHDLVSVVAPLGLADTLELHDGPPGTGTLGCDSPGGDVPCGSDNLVLKAAALFRRETGWTGGAAFRLTKRIPAGAGLGGGSSDAATALRLLATHSGIAAAPATLAAWAAELGSDCPLFLHDGPVVMRGRGERIEPLPGNAASRLRGRAVLLMKPSIAISTAWAYGALSKGAPASYADPAAAERHVRDWIAGGAPAGALYANSFEAAVWRKFPALPVLAQEVKNRFGLDVHMSGSGSCCFCLLPEAGEPPGLSDMVREAWGDAAFITRTAIR